VGVQVEPLAMVCEWAVNGNIVDYIAENSNANKVSLVGFPLHVGPPAYSLASYLMPFMVLLISTSAI